MLRIRIGGVPEHFNYPWILATEQKKFSQCGIDLTWVDYPGGTGPMCHDLKNGAIDLAVLLTEGISKDIIAGNPSRIIRWFITTPLLWGIHVANSSPYHSIEEIKDKRYAISRYGSGSHLMACVDVSFRGWNITPEQFLECGGLTGALEALDKGDAEVFMWEKFMTKPWVDNGILRRIGERPTPWPCFSLAGSENFITKHRKTIEQILAVTNNFDTMMRAPEIAKKVSEIYKLKKEDVENWLNTTAWADSNSILSSDLQMVINALDEAKIISSKKITEKLTSELTYLY
jgi:sulfonate transport system substrate-binding protein